MAASKRKSDASHHEPSKTAKKDITSTPAANVTDTIPSALVSSIWEEEPLFPRGGASVLTPLEHKKIKIQATQDALFEEISKPAREAPEKLAPRRKPRSSRDKSVQEKADDTQNVLKVVEGLKFKHLVKGSLVVGQVCGIRRSGLLLALPNKLFGHVSHGAISQRFDDTISAASEASSGNSENVDTDPVLSILTKTFFLGQRLRAYVLSTEESAPGIEIAKRKIELSIRPERANLGITTEHVGPNMAIMASVMSVEDHGYVMDTGLGPKLLGFMLKKEVDVRSGVDIEPGAVRLCLVSSQKSGTVVQLSSKMDKFEKPKSTLTDAAIVEAFLPGTRAEVLITDIASNGVIGKIGGILDATAQATDCGKAPGTELEKHFSIGSKHQGRILCTYPAAEQPKVGVSFVPMAEPIPRQAELSDVDIGSLWMASVARCSPSCLWASIGPNIKGRVDRLNLPGATSKPDALESTYPAGKLIPVRVLSIDADKRHVDLTARLSERSRPLAWDSLSDGRVMMGRVIAVRDKITVRLSTDLVGTVDLVDVADDFDQAKSHGCQPDDMVHVSVIKADKSNHKICLSLRPSRTSKSAPHVKDPEIKEIAQLSTGDLVRGFIKSISDKGLFVSLGCCVTGMVQIKDLSDKFLKKWKGAFEVGQLLKARVIHVSAKEGHVRLSLRGSVLDENYKPLVTYETIREGMVLPGKVRKVEAYGAFIVIDNSANVSGLCHRSEMADNKVNDARTLYHEGDLVKAIVLGVDAATRRITLGLKSSYVEDASDELGKGGDELKSTGSVDGVSEDDEVAHEMDGLDIDTAMERKASGTGKLTKSRVEASRGLNAGGFDWNAQMEDSDADMSIDEESSIPKKKKKRTSKISAETDVNADASGPMTAAEHEQAIIVSPDDSQLWITYMAFQLGNGDVAKCRDVAERAIGSINPREQDERLAVWTAYMNAELEYGSEESLEDVFARACQENDEKKVYESLIHIYISTGRTDAAEKLFEQLIKKFGPFNVDVWINYAKFLSMTVGDQHRARDLLRRASDRLGRDYVIPLTAKFAAIEYRSPNGLAERGHTLFEGILTSFPKRMDIWNQFVDLEITNGDAQVVRNVFEQGSQAKGLKAHGAKKWFKKWADWELEKGDGAEGKNRVLKKAAEWVRAAEERKTNQILT